MNTHTYRKNRQGWVGGDKETKIITNKLNAYIERAKSRGKSYIVVDKWHTESNLSTHRTYVYNRVELEDTVTKEHIKMYIVVFFVVFSNRDMRRWNKA